MVEESNKTKETAKIPKHIAIVTKGKTIWAKENNKSIQEAYKRSFALVKETILSAIDVNVPILTFYILSTDFVDSDKFTILIDYIKEFFEELKETKIIHDNRIKISIFGKWYDLPGRAVDSIKDAIEATKDYDKFFVNFCINYSGQEEIIDSIKILARQVSANKLDPDSINASVVKENVYSSYFLPPDLIIVNGPAKATNGLLLWDSVRSNLYFTGRLWPDFNKEDLIKAIGDFRVS